MTAAKIAITLLPEQVDKVRAAVKAGRAASVSAYIARAIDDQAAELCAFTRAADVIDASVVLTAREHDDPILTSDIGDLQRLDPKATLERI